MQLSQPHKIVLVPKEEEKAFYKENPDFKKVPEHLQKIASELAEKGLTGMSNRQLKKWARNEVKRDGLELKFGQQKLKEIEERFRKTGE